MLCKYLFEDGLRFMGLTLLLLSSSNNLNRARSRPMVLDELITDIE
jgi:hypothetical protein